MNRNKLRIYLKTVDDDNDKYILIFQDEKNKLISEVNLKEDDNFESINKVNEFILKKIKEYDELEFYKEHLIERMNKDQIMKRIVYHLEETWINEFNDIKQELNNFLNIE